MSNFFCLNSSPTTCDRSRSRRLSDSWLSYDDWGGNGIGLVGLVTQGTRI